MKTFIFFCTRAIFAEREKKKRDFLTGLLSSGHLKLRGSCQGGKGVFGRKERNHFVEYFIAAVKIEESKVNSTKEDVESLPRLRYQMQK